MNNIRKILTERLENARLDYGKTTREPQLELKGQIEAYQDCLNLIPTPKTEQDILNDFEKLGWIVSKNDEDAVTLRLKQELYLILPKNIRDNLIDTIKQDLERLEVLEIENKALRENVKEIEDLYLKENKHWCETIDSLRKENQELKEKLEGIPLEYDGYLYFTQSISNVVKENEKLKKAIEIIKTLPNCDICDANWHKGCMCLQRKIKEVLNDE